jgi:hypothetical protein
MHARACVREITTKREREADLFLDEGKDLLHGWIRAPLGNTCRRFVIVVARAEVRTRIDERNDGLVRLVPHGHVKRRRAVLVRVIDRRASPDEVADDLRVERKKPAVLCERS